MEPVSREEAERAFDDLVAERDLELAAEAHVDRVIAEAIVAGDQRARNLGIAALKQMIGSPAWLDGALEAFCYGPELEHRLKGWGLIEAWLKKEGRL